MATPKEVTEVEMPRAVIHLEALVGSSIFDVKTENCDAIQLLGAAAMLEQYGRMALAQDLQRATTSASKIETIRGRIKGI